MSRHRISIRFTCKAPNTRRAPICEDRPVGAGARVDEPYELTSEQREIQALCREFAAREIRPVSLAVDAADTEVPWELWYRAAELGLTSFMLPEEYGGGGLTDLLTQSV